MSLASCALSYPVLCQAGVLISQPAPEMEDTVAFRLHTQGRRDRGRKALGSTHPAQSGREAHPCQMAVSSLATESGSVTRGCVQKARGSFVTLRYGRVLKLAFKPLVTSLSHHPSRAPKCPKLAHDVAGTHQDCLHPSNHTAQNSAEFHVISTNTYYVSDSDSSREKIVQFP